MMCKQTPVTARHSATDTRDSGDGWNINMETERDKPDSRRDNGSVCITVSEGLSVVADM